MHLSWSRELSELGSDSIDFTMGEWYVLSLSWSNVDGYLSLRLADVETSTIVNTATIDTAVNMG